MRKDALLLVYLALNRLFPNSFTAKVFFIAFLGTHVPLIAATAFLFLRNGGMQENAQLALILLLATLIGTTVTLASLHSVLRPLYRVGDAMRRFEAERKRTPLPDTLNDEIGQVMQLTNRLVLGVDAELRATQEAATTDPLTGALNRRGFERRLNATPAQRGVLLYADLDHFKSINDTLGHDAGDKVLLQTADTMRETLRRCDILGRFGGEEFVIFLPDLTQAEGAAVANRLRRSLSDAVTLTHRKLTVSIGATCLSSTTDFADALSRADKALYRAKSNGRNRVEYARKLAN